MPLAVRAVARSDVGLVRKSNEDSGYAGPRVLAVADGMGGHAAGEVASAIAIETLADLDGPARESEDGEAELRDAIARSHDRIAAMIAANEARTGMGTTVTALLWNGVSFDLIQIGDSRAYRLRDGELHQVTHDQTYVQMLMDAGRLDPDEVATHPARSLLLQALGGGDQPDPAVDHLDARPGDRWLLCSDGLSGVVSDQTIASILQDTPSRAEAADALVSRAIGGGAPDNVTVVVADVVEVAEPAPSADDTTEAHLVGAAARGASVVGDDEGGPDSGSAHEEDHESLRYRLRERRAPAWVRLVVLVGVGALVLGLVAVLANSWYQRQYYVTSEDDEVIIVQGVPSLPGGDTVFTAPSFPASSLPDVSQMNLADGIVADDQGDARQLVDDLRRQACVSHPPRDPVDVTEEEPGPSGGTPTTGEEPEPSLGSDTSEAPSVSGDATAPEEPDATTEPTSSFPGLECTDDQP
jgi:serine/threonine protein phosphatase PrpC